ncbi:ATP-binding cassette domain-containing protein [Hippea jasoniae]|uniref:ATP-binding cassette domain-containing protein n=1 Tax=Hippea jasoniae TaxID=944479 RepID=UPI0006921474|nr:ABC transporter ATP-binding protein [Hippea jasoniae]
MIKIRNVIKDFGKGAVLKDINLTIEKGERVMVVGGNGSGKTTLLRCIIGSYSFEGQISILDMDARKDKSRLASFIGYVPQVPPPILMSVEQLIDFVADVDGNENEKDLIYQMLDKLNFEKSGIKRHFKKLSGGMQKKVLVAIALGRQPDILILDEPLAYIDPQSRMEISRAINEMPAELTLIYTSHKEEKGSIKADRIIEMDNGLVVRDEPYSDEVEN